MWRALAVVGLLGCGGGSSTPDAAPPDAPFADGAPDALPGAVHYQYVIERIFVPTTATQSNMYGLNIDNDEQSRPDNAMGRILSTLQSQTSDLLFQVEADALMSSGAVLELLDLETTTLVDASVALLRRFEGEDLDAPDDNFSGAETFDIAVDSPLDSLVVGSIIDGDLMLGPGTLWIPVFFVGNPVYVRLAGARVDGVVTETGIATGRLGGGIPEQDLTDILIPGMHLGVMAGIDADCNPSGTMPPCNCGASSQGEVLLGLFDEIPDRAGTEPDGDCMVTLDEFHNNGLIGSLLLPDVDLFDSGDGGAFAPRQDGIADSLSLGYAFSGVSAAFDLP